MGYQSVKDHISKMLKAKGFIESKEVFSFEEGSDQSTNKKFMLEREEIDLQAEGTEYLAYIVRPRFLYKLTLGFKIAAQSQIMDYDISQNLVDTIIAYLNNPANYSSAMVKMKTTNLTTHLVDEHLEVLIQLEVLDDITLTTS